jgi:hypothetical protein
MTPAAAQRVNTSRKTIDARGDSAAPANSSSPKSPSSMTSPSAGRYRCRHLLQRHNGFGEVLQDEAAVYEVIRRGFQTLAGDVMAAHLDRCT